MVFYCASDYIINDSIPFFTIGQPARFQEISHLRKSTNY